MPTKWQALPWTASICSCPFTDLNPFSLPIYFDICAVIYFAFCNFEIQSRDFNFCPLYLGSPRGLNPQNIFKRILPSKNKKSVQNSLKSFTVCTESMIYLCRLLSEYQKYINRFMFPRSTLSHPVRSLHEIDWLLHSMRH